MQFDVTVPTLRDRVCMTAAMLVLEPIFEADLPPEQYAYRPGRNAQQAVIKKGYCSVATRKSSMPTSRTTSEAFQTPIY